MRIIIVGDGKVGAALTESLTKEGHDIVVIDTNRKLLEKSTEVSDILVVHGNGASMSVLKQADVGTADLLIAATSSDEINLLTCIMAKKLAKKLHTIARVRNPEYAEQLVALKDELGLSMTVNPEQAAAREAYHLIQFPSFLRRDTFARGQVAIVKLRINANSPLNGVPLSKMPEIAKVKVLICAVERGEQVYIPDGQFVLQENDDISVTASSQDLTALIKNLGLQKQKIKNAVIIGGSRIAFYLTALLMRSGIRVKIIEKDHERCLHLATLLPKAVIIEGDGSQQSILEAEGLDQADALLTFTDMDEENLIISMYGHHIGVPKVITKINRIEYVDVFKSMGVDTIISPKELCSNDVVRYVRAMQNTSGGSMIALHRIVGGKVEAMEFQAAKNTRHLEEPLEKLALKKGILVACITHQGKTIIPRGSDCIQEGDTVILVSTEENTLLDLNNIFAD